MEDRISNRTVQAGSSLNDILKRLYYATDGAAASGSKEKLFKEALKEIPDLKRGEVDEWLRSQLTYTLHAPARKNFIRNRIVVFKIDEEWEADLVEMQEFAKENNGYRYILTIIDVFSKYAWVKPIKNKTGKLVSEAFAEVFNERKPDSLRTDKGKEFMNSELQNLLKKNHVRYYTAKNPEIKCAVIERFNRTFKSRMFKYFTSVGKRKWIDQLSHLQNGYNKSYHRTIRMAPIEVSLNNSEAVFKNTYGEDNLRELLQAHKPATKLKIGDEVRMKYKLGVFDKGFYPSWSDRVYKISSIDKSKRIALHGVDDSADARKYYPHELQKVNATVHRVERILKRRTYKGKIQYLVKWLNYPSSFNSWIDATEITSIQ